MKTHQDGNCAGSLVDALHRAFGDEPPLTLNLQSIAQAGAHRLRHRRVAAVGGAMFAVAALTAGVAIGVPQLAGPSGAASGSSPRIPGCATVLRTDDPAVTRWREGSTAAAQTSSTDTGPASSSSADSTTQGTPGPAAANVAPVPAWLTAAKVDSMAAAFYAAIPRGAHLSAPDSSAQAGPLPFAAGSGVPGGGGVLTAGSVRAYLSIGVQPWDKGAPPCTADLALRYISADGSITDVIDNLGTTETGHYMLAESFRPDGTLVDVGLNDSGGIVPPTTALPLTAEQLAAIAAAPALAITAH